MNPHQAPRASIDELFASFWRNRQLILQMTKREVISRYRGSVMGLAWSFFNPILMLAVYTFVFSVVFKARWGVGGEENKASFAILLFVGIIVHGVFAECANRAPGLILANVNYVKKVVFPLEILPWVAMGSTLFHSGISLIVLLLAQLLLNHTMPFTAVFFPIIILPLLLATMGVAWFLSAIGVYVRDVSQTIGILTTVLMFLSPVFYPLSALPKEYQIWVKLNPLTFTLEEGRKSLIFGQTPNGVGWGIYMFVSIAIAWMGFWWFQKSRKGFADVL
jgi:lipopolysaccharide transport system permease protein